MTVALVAVVMHRHFETCYTTKRGFFGGSRGRYRTASKGLWKCRKLFSRWALVASDLAVILKETPLRDVRMTNVFA